MCALFSFSRVFRKIFKFLWTYNKNSFCGIKENERTKKKTCIKSFSPFLTRWAWSTRFVFTHYRHRGYSAQKPTNNTQHPHPQKKDLVPTKQKLLFSSGLSNPDKITFRSFLLLVHICTEQYYHEKSQTKKYLNVFISVIVSWSRHIEP